MFYYIEDYTKGMVLYPVREKFGETSYYRLQFAEYIALIKVDNRKSIKEFASYQLSPDKALILTARNFANTSESKLFLKLYDINEDKLPPWFGLMDPSTTLGITKG